MSRCRTHAGDFGGILSGLASFRVSSGLGEWQQRPGTRVSEHFAITQNADEYGRLADTWSLTHLPSGLSGGWAKDGEILAWLALHLEALDRSDFLGSTSAEAFKDHPEFEAFCQEKHRLFGAAQRLDGAASFGW